MKISLPSPEKLQPNLVSIGRDIPPVTVALEGVHIGHDHDPWPAGDGEFYWVAIASDGVDLATLASKDVLGATGTHGSVQENTWLDLPAREILCSDQRNRRASISFLLKEADRPNQVQNMIFDAAGAGLAGIVGVILGPEASLAVAALVGLVSAALNLNDDDTCIQSPGTEDDGGSGFIVLKSGHVEGRGPNEAIFSYRRGGLRHVVMPLQVGDGEHWTPPNFIPAGDYSVTLPSGTSSILIRNFARSNDGTVPVKAVTVSNGSLRDTVQVGAYQILTVNPAHETRLKAIGLPVVGTQLEVVAL